MKPNSLLENCREYYEEKYPSIMVIPEINVIYKGHVIGEFFNKYIFKPNDPGFSGDMVIEARHLKILVKG